MPDNLRSSIMQYECSEDTAYLTHGIFRWYGKLVPQLVSDILKMYTAAGDTVLANFNGSGTIALECLSRNVNAIGTDINPLALLVSRVKTRRIEDFDIDDKIGEILSKAKSAALCEGDYKNLYDYRKWYSKQEIDSLLKIKKVINELQDGAIKEFFSVSLLSIVRECSKIDSRCVNHIVVDKKKTDRDVFSHFMKEAEKNYAAVKKLDEIEYNPSIDFRLCDARKTDFIENESIDLVFSHPPYLNAINYYNIHRLCTDLADYHYEDIRGKDFSAKKADDFLSFMNETFSESERVLKPGKRLVAVIGDVRYKGNILPLQVEFVNLLRKNHFDIEDIFIWILNKKAGMNVARRGNHIDHNFVIVAKKKES